MLRDSDARHWAASNLRLADAGRDPAGLDARLADQFLNANRGLLADLGVTGSVAYDGSSVRIVFASTTTIGAVPLISPSTGRPDIALLIEPRFPWVGLGGLLGEMGWRVVPDILPLPLLPTSARSIPRWVLSATVLRRLQLLSARLGRTFEFACEDRPAPRGSVDWTAYATTRAAVGAFHRVPCRFPDLDRNHELLSAVHYALRLQKDALATQRTTGGLIVARLLDLCDSLLHLVIDVTPRPIRSAEAPKLFRAPISTSVFRDGLEAVEWTVDERGLAGESDLRGLPWRMQMQKFFEAWIETVAARVAREVGGTLRVGRKAQTTVPLEWNPPYLGSQKSLKPDVVITRHDATVIIDAKYKRHWEEFQEQPWAAADESLREEHRNDMLQVLAYANCARTEKVTVVLAYPCRPQLWEANRARDRCSHVAEITAGYRRVRVVLTAIPLVPEHLTDVVSELARLVSSA